MKSLGKIFTLAVLAAPFGSGCGSDGGSGGPSSCPDVSGSWAVSGNCPPSSCTFTQTGCSLRGSCDDGATVTGTVGPTGSVSFAETGVRCNGTLGSPGHLAGGCQSSSGQCTFDATCSTGACGTPPASTGSGGGSGTGGGASSSCSAPPAFGCGTSAAGTLACPAGQVCCLSPGCDSSNPYQGNGAASRCVDPSAPSGTNDQCASPAIELCANDAACGTGYHCDAAQYYCVPN